MSKSPVLDRVREAFYDWHKKRAEFDEEAKLELSPDIYHHISCEEDQWGAIFRPYDGSPETIFGLRFKIKGFDEEGNMLKDYIKVIEPEPKRKYVPGGATILL